MRPLLTAIVVASAAAAWYMRTYAVMLDPTMVQNILRTDSHEAGELLNWDMAGWVMAWSALPLAASGWCASTPAKPLRAMLLRAGSVFAALVIATLAFLAISRDLTSFMRNQREAALSDHARQLPVRPGRAIPCITWRTRTSRANLSAPTRGSCACPMAASPRVLVLVIGETARAANFSLLGYPRETNPELARLDITAFSNVTSCGTSTEVSVPCMFSPYGRANYDERRIRNSEGLLDVLARAGLCGEVAGQPVRLQGRVQGRGHRVSRMSLPNRGRTSATTKSSCAASPKSSRRCEGNTVFVLHMIGNHGPAYFRRYPAEFRRFLPDCETAQLRDCTREQVVNAYDNAILYTDHVLASVIGTLKRAPRRFHSSMIYVSDHGESLGEHGLYLHGIPYAIAPELQTHVPMLVWVSWQMSASGDVDVSCLRGKSRDALSHDNLFHSVIGLMDVRTAAYLPARDIFDGCRGGVARSYAQATADKAR